MNLEEMIKGIIAQMEALMAVASAPVVGPDGVPTPGMMSPEQARSYDELKEKLDSARAQLKREKEVRALTATKKPEWRGAQKTDLTRGDDADSEFRNFLRTGEIHSAEFRAQGEGFGSEGGFLVPEGFRNKMIERCKAFGGVEDLAEKITTAEGNPLPWPTNDDVNNLGEIVPENASPVSGADLVFGVRSLGAHKYMSVGTGGQPLKVSWELLQDSAFGLEDFVARRLGERIGRLEAPHLVTGTGIGQPQGLVTGTTAVGVTIAINSVGPTYSEFIDAIHALDPCYREGGASFVMNDTSVAKMEKLLDTTGRPLFQRHDAATAADKVQGTISGYPVYVDQAFANYATSTAGAVFGNIAQAYVVRRVKDVTLVRLDELFALSGQVGFLSWTRMDAVVQDSNAVVRINGV